MLFHSSIDKYRQLPIDPPGDSKELDKSVRESLNLHCVILQCMLSMYVEVTSTIKNFFAVCFYRLCAIFAWGSFYVSTLVMLSSL